MCSTRPESWFWRAPSLRARSRRPSATRLGKGEGVLSLVDEKGRRVIVPVDKIAYIEIAEAQSRPVGFSTA